MKTLAAIAKKLSPVLPVDRPLVCEFEISFVNEFRRLYRNGMLAVKEAAGKATQFVIDDRQKLIQSFAVSFIFSQFVEK